MTTATIPTPADRLPVGATPVREGGLLSRVTRACPEHGGEAGCVGCCGGAGFWGGTPSVGAGSCVGGTVVGSVGGIGVDSAGGIGVDVGSGGCGAGVGGTGVAAGED